MGRRRVDLQTAAGLLGISSDAVRKRAKRGTMPHEIGADGKLYVWVDAGRTGPDSAGVDEAGRGAGTAGRDELVQILREQLQAERQAHAEARRLLMAALERIPAVEAPQTPAEDAGGAEPRPTPQEAQEGAQPRSSWWRRFFGFE